MPFRCIFLPGNGSFFVNYIITAAFIGTALELMRFSELLVYGIRLLLARSMAERAAVRKVGNYNIFHLKPLKISRKECILIHAIMV